jgi:hypothetical protein
MVRRFMDIVALWIDHIGGWHLCPDLPTEYEGRLEIGVGGIAVGLVALHLGIDEADIIRRLRHAAQIEQMDFGVLVDILLHPLDHALGGRQIAR